MMLMLAVSKVRMHKVTELIAAVIITAIVLFSGQAASAGQAFKLEVIGFGKTIAYEALVYEDGQAYISIEALTESLRLGIREEGHYSIISWAGKTAKITDGTLAIGHNVLPSPVVRIEGQLYFPLKGVTAFGVKLAIDEKAGTAQITVPRSQIIGMGKLQGNGPSVYYVQLSFAPSDIESFVLSAPDRLVIDLYETIVDPQQSKDLTATEATRIRASMNRPGVARVVLELTKSGAGAKVHQDKYDPTLIRISYPARILSVDMMEKGMGKGFEIIGSAGMASAAFGYSDGSIMVFLQDFIADKSLKTTGMGYTVSPQEPYGSIIRLEANGLEPSDPVYGKNSVFIPLRNVITNVKALNEGALIIKLGFFEKLGAFEYYEDQSTGKLLLSLPNMAGILPLELEGLAENSISIALEEKGEGLLLLTFSGMPAAARSIASSLDGKTLEISFGGSIKEVSFLEDMGVTRITYKYEGQSGEASIAVDLNGNAILTFPGVTGLAKDIKWQKDIQDKGRMEFSKDEAGLACILVLNEGLIPVLRQSRAQGTAIVDIGFEMPGYKLERADNSTKITINAVMAMKPEVFRLREPDRLVVDLPGFVEATQRAEQIDDVEMVIKARSGQNTIGVARLVFDLNRYLGHTWALADDEATLEITLADKLTGLSGRLILLDPGHGGTDGGAVGNGLIEKEINLDIALKLRSMLEASGATVIMTRSEDARVELLERSATANLLLPDAIISIHANSFISTGANGTETYYFNTEELSRELAASVHKSLVDRIKLTNRGIFKKEYHMITATSSPSILVEVGFLSNKQDAAYLMDPAFRQKAAEGIFDGIASYFVGDAHEKWASIKESLIQSSASIRYEAPALAWPGLMLYEPWVIEATMPIEPAIEIDLTTGATPVN